MSNLLSGAGIRDVYVSDGGNNGKSGYNPVLEKRTFNNDLVGDGALQAAMDRGPSLFTPVGIVDTGASRFIENLVIPDNVQVSAPSSSFQGVGGTLVTAGANANFDALTLSTSTLEDDVAYTTDGKSRVGLTSKAIILNGDFQTGVHIDEDTDQAFPNVGQILARGNNSVCVEILGAGEDPQYHQLNEVNFNGDDCRGILCDTNTTNGVVFRAGAITYIDDPTQPLKSGANSVGIEVLSGVLIGYAAQLRSEFVVVVDEPGELTLDALRTDGHMVVNGEANITTRKHAGDILVGPNGSLTIRCDEMVGGSIVNQGLLEGQIGKTLYGGWQDIYANTISNTFSAPGNIPNSPRTLGYLTMDTSTDTLSEVIGAYSQTTPQSRGVIFNIRDADNPGVLYYTITTSNSSVDTYVNFDLSDMTPVNPLPVDQVVNLLLTYERDTPQGGIRDFNVQIDRNRIP